MSSPFYSLASIMLKDPEKIQSLVYAIDFFLYIERGRTAIRRLVKSGAP